MKPMLFNTEMARAILEGRKTVTRRVIKPQPTYSQNSGFSWRGKAYGTDIPQTFKGAVYNFRCAAPIKVNDILYVRETWKWLSCRECNRDMWKYSPCKEGKYNFKLRKCGCYVFKADVHNAAADNLKWKPSIHMPKEAARIFLRVTSVRVERLQDIRTDDILAEGVDTDLEGLRELNLLDMADGMFKKAFKRLWDSTIKKDQLDLYSWWANPYVWVIEFEPISKELVYELERQKEAT